MYVCNCIGLTEDRLREKLEANTGFLPFLAELGFDIKNDNYCGKCFKEILNEIAKTSTTK